MCVCVCVCVCFVVFGLIKLDYTQQTLSRLPTATCCFMVRLVIALADGDIPDG